jgi:hypothetical protein
MLKAEVSIPVKLAGVSTITEVDMEAVLVGLEVKIDPSTVTVIAAGTGWVASMRTRRVCPS